MVRENLSLKLLDWMHTLYSIYTWWIILIHMRMCCMRCVRIGNFKFHWKLKWKSAYTLQLWNKHALLAVLLSCFIKTNAHALSSHVSFAMCGVRYIKEWQHRNQCCMTTEFDWVTEITAEHTNTKPDKPRTKKA